MGGATRMGIVITTRCGCPLYMTGVNLMALTASKIFPSMCGKPRMIRHSYADSQLAAPLPRRDFRGKAHRRIRATSQEYAISSPDNEAQFDGVIFIPSWD